MLKKSCLTFLLGLAACHPADKEVPAGVDPRQAMREFVVEIADSGRKYHPGFIVIPQNGQELATLDGDAAGPLALDYLRAIDGVGREDLFYGYNSDNKATPAADRNYLLSFLEVCAQEGVVVLTIDYCSDTAKMRDALAQNAALGYLSFPAPSRNLEVIPTYPSPLVGQNTTDVVTLDQAKNFLYLINPEQYPSKSSFLAALAATPYDLILIDAFFNEETYLASEIAALRTKPGGGSRLVIAYMSIGEAEDYRYYWQSAWKKNPPSWLAGENRQWKGNYKVRYWEAGWQALVLSKDTGYLHQVLDAGFDGVYLDIIDAFEYFE